MSRYVRELSTDLGQLTDAAGRGERPLLLALVSPQGIRARQDLGRLREALFGIDGPTATHEGAPGGLLLIHGPGARKEGVIAGQRPLTSVAAPSACTAKRIAAPV